MSTWNDGAVPRICHCSDCDAPPEPACKVCQGDGIEIDEWGLCAECRPTETETTAEYEERMQGRRK